MTMDAEIQQGLVIPIEKGVKLLDRKGGRLTSFCAPSLGAITYPIGKWVGPRFYCGPLAVFDTLENALQFMRLYYGIESKRFLPPGYAFFNCLFIRSRYQTFWAGAAGKIHCPPFPTGTQFADLLQLVEEIDNCTLPF